MNRLLIVLTCLFVITVNTLADEVDWSKFESKIAAMNYAAQAWTDAHTKNHAASKSDWRAVKEKDGVHEALAEVNARRAERGLRPFIYDEGLTQAAAGCAEYPADRLMAGHTSNDFAAVPSGTRATAAGCAAWPQEMGFGACCVFDNYTYAGAAWKIGRDGRRFCHLFVK